MRNIKFLIFNENVISRFLKTKIWLRQKDDKKFGNVMICNPNALNNLGLMDHRPEMTQFFEKKRNLKKILKIGRTKKIVFRKKEKSFR